MAEKRPLCNYSGSVKELQSGDSVPGGSGLPALTVVSGTSQTAAADSHYALTNASATTVTLPASPTAADVVVITVNNGRTDNVIDRNGKEINGVAEDMTIDAAYGSVWLRYIDATRQWRTW